MFRLYKIREFERNATLLDFERIVSPKRGLELACYYYVLDYEEYNSRLYFDIPKRKWNGDRHFSGKYKRKSRGIKPRPTQKIQYGAPGYVEPEQHAQSSKTLNSRNVGRLLAAGGV